MLNISWTISWTYHDSGNHGNLLNYAGHDLQLVFTCHSFPWLEAISTTSTSKMGCLGCHGKVELDDLLKSYLPHMPYISHLIFLTFLRNSNTLCPHCPHKNLTKTIKNANQAPLWTRDGLLRSRPGKSDNSTHHRPGRPKKVDVKSDWVVLISIGISSWMLGLFSDNFPWNN